MSRILAFDRDDGITAPFHDGEREWDVPVPDARDDEVADLLARVIVAAGHELPTSPGLIDGFEVWQAWEMVAESVARLRAALARDAAAKEQERAEQAAVEALRVELDRAYYAPGNPGWPEVARRAYELGARAPQAEEADRG